MARSSKLLPDLLEIREIKKKRNEKVKKKKDKNLVYSFSITVNRLVQKETQKRAVRNVQVPEDSAGRNIIHENLSPSLSISFPILLPPSLLPRSKFSSSRERSRHFLLLSSSHVSSMVSRVNIDRPRRCYCCYYRCWCCCCYP